MSDVFRAAVSEPASSNAWQYARRVRTLALLYVLLFTVSIAGEVLIAWKGQFFVSLAQRSNIETLTLAFFAVFFGYIALISMAGAFGALRLAYHTVSGLWIKDWRVVEQHKVKAVGPARQAKLEVAMNVRVHEEGRPDERIEIEVADEAGVLGLLRMDGARFAFFPKYDHSSNSIFAYVEHQVNDILEAKGSELDINVLAWKSIDDDLAEQYFSTVKFARNLEKALGAGELWPQVILTSAEIAELKTRLSQICRALRNECFLPDWEYYAEHKVPIIPEPLGLVSIGRSERRADPLATMGMATGVVIVSVIVLGLIIAFPPWVPG